MNLEIVENRSTTKPGQGEPLPKKNSLLIEPQTLDSQKQVERRSLLD
jgi:hypothetical protein